jgi:hypothetical protein
MVIVCRVPKASGVCMAHGAVCLGEGGVLGSGGQSPISTGWQHSAHLLQGWAALGWQLRPFLRILAPDTSCSAGAGGNVQSVSVSAPGKRKQARLLSRKYEIERTDPNVHTKEGQQVQKPQLRAVMDSE